MPEVPLSFIHVSLTQEIADSLKSVDVATEDVDPRCAIFYSVNSPYNGLGGLDLAARVIKKAAASVKEEFPSIDTFSTLSPIPGFMNWLSAKASKGESVGLPDEHVSSIKEVAASFFGKTLSSEADVIQWIESKLKTTEADGSVWTSDDVLTLSLKNPLLWLGSHYIANEKAKSKDKLSLPLDLVTRFHVRNGAIFHRLNWLANPASYGLHDSAGMMVNYLYTGDAKVHEDRMIAFLDTKGVVPVGDSVSEILKRK
jgi:malonyl-CoA decarboxylase